MVAPAATAETVAAEKHLVQRRVVLVVLVAWVVQAGRPVR